MISNSFSLQWRALQHEAGTNSDHKEADHFDEYITGCVNTREAVPVQVGNVRCDRGRDSSNKSETDPSGKAAKIAFGKSLAIECVREFYCRCSRRNRDVYLDIPRARYQPRCPAPKLLTKEVFVRLINCGKFLPR